MEKLVLIDGNSLANRAFYAIPQTLANSQGFITNAIYGFCNMLTKIMKDETPDYILVAFDASKKVFRHELYENYKGSRKGMPEELRAQMPVLRDVLSAMGIDFVDAPGYEADDIIGTMAKRASSAGIYTDIITGDRDSFQLIDDYTKVLFTRKGISELEIFDKDHLMETYQLEPWQIIELKGLAGDNSDDIPGIDGIGEKTAIKLLLEHKSVEGVLNAKDQYAGKKIGEKLSTGADMARLSKQLATIDCNIPLDLSVNSLNPKKGNVNEKIRLFKELGFKQLYENALKELEDKPAESVISSSKEEFNVYEIKTGDELINLNLVEKIAKSDSYVSVVLINNIQGVTKHIGIKAKGFDGIWISPIDNDELILCLKTLEPVFKSDTVEKVLYDSKVFYLLLERSGLDTDIKVRDLSLLSYLLNPNYPRANLTNLEILDPKLLEKREKDKLKLGEALFNKEEKTEILESIEVLYPDLISKIKENGMYDLYMEIEEPLAKILGSMESTGIRVDTEVLRNLGTEVLNKAQIAENRIYEIAGESFNINSPKQLGVILFEKLGLPAGKKTKSGYSTDAETLELLAANYEIANLILTYRTYAKLKSTYIDGLLPLINPGSSRIHTHFQQTITATGRLSSTEPNLQNIPVRIEEGRQIRKAFVASPGNVLLSCDYSQIELRVLAHLCGDENLQEAFIEGADIHRKTASEVFGIDPELVTKEQRRAAKAVNFGLIYGISDFGLSQDLGITRSKAKEYMETYFNRYPKVKTYFDKVVADAEISGYVETLFKRRRYMPELKSSNFQLRAFGKRACMNAPIQGTAADIMKLAMIKVYELLAARGLEKHMLLTVHDELIFELKEDIAVELYKEIKNTMETVVDLAVPLVADAKMGTDWYNMKNL